MPRLSIHHARPILGTALAALLALTTVIPGPATAQQGGSGIDPQLSRIIGGLLIAGGVAKVLDDRNDRRDARRREEARQETERQAAADRAAAQRLAERREAERRDAEEAARHRRDRDYRAVVEPDRRHGRRARTLPASCLRDDLSASRVRRVVGQQCLQRSGVDVSLPVDCATLIESRGRFRTAYDARCLSDAGFRFR